MSTGKTIGFFEILAEASREVATWPEWKRDPEALAWQRQTEERRRQLEEEKAKAAAAQANPSK